MDAPPLPLPAPLQLYKPLEFLFLVAAFTTLAENFLPQLMSLPKSIVQASGGTGGQCVVVPGSAAGCTLGRYWPGFGIFRPQKVAAPCPGPTYQHAQMCWLSILWCTRSDTLRKAGLPPSPADRGPIHAQPHVCDCSGAGRVQHQGPVSRLPWDLALGDCLAAATCCNRPQHAAVACP